MTANQVIALAKGGELLQISPAIKNDMDIMVGYINLALIELFKRFPMKTDEALITLVSGKSIYQLDGTDVDVVMGDPYFYMIAAYGEEADADYGMITPSLPINVEDNICSINSIGVRAIQVPLVTQGAMISIIYAAQPILVTTLTLDTELDVPEQFVEPLLHYIGYRAHGSMDGNIQTESNTHYMRFEASCNKLRELGVGITPDDIDMGSRLGMRGFV
jgi:hypothetical protein